MAILILYGFTSPFNEEGDLWAREEHTEAIEDVAAAAKAKFTEIQVPDVKEHIVAIWLIERPIRSLGESNMNYNIHYFTEKCPNMSCDRWPKPSPKKKKK